MASNTVATPVKLGPKVELLIIAYGSKKGDPTDNSRYGSHQRRVEVTFGPHVPMELAGNMRRMQNWARDRVTATIMDIKHSQRWHCEFCGAHPLLLPC